MAKRVLVVAEDPNEWRALAEELGGRLDLVRATTTEQAIALLQSTSDLAAVVSDWGRLSRGPQLMMQVQRLRPALVRVLITDAPKSGDAHHLSDTGVVRLLVAKPWAKGTLSAAVTRAVGVDAPSHALRAEPRAVISVQLEVSTSAWSGFKPLWTKDASRGGVFLLYGEHVMPTSGSPCVLKLGATPVAAQIAHVVTQKISTAAGLEAGFGVCFVARQATDWWEPLVSRTAAAGAQAPRPPASAGPTAKEIAAAKSLASLGQHLLETKSYSAARQKFELAARVLLDPLSQAMPLVCSALQFARLGLADKAKESFERALLLAPDCAEARKGLDELAKAKRR